MGKKQYYIPIEVGENNRMFEDSDVKVGWVFVHGQSKRGVKIEVSEELYREYIRPEWRESKRQERHLALSLEGLDEDYDFEPESDTDVEGMQIKAELLEALYRELEQLQDMDREIMRLFANGCSESSIGRVVGLSQKAVNKRKHKILQRLREHLADFR